MRTLKVAFWNVESLFDPTPSGPRRRHSPATAAELDDKLDQLAGIIGRMFDGKGPDLLAVAEIATPALFDRLCGRLSATQYPPALRVFEPATQADQTGLGLVGRDGVVAQLTLTATWTVAGAARPHILSVECGLTGIRAPVQVVVNHWRSRRRQSGGPANAIGGRDRRDAAEWLGTHLDLRAKMRPAIVLGDFNCEPHEAPFRTAQFRGTQRTSTARQARTGTTTLYNTAWRFTTEPDPWPRPRSGVYRASRPKLTWHRSTGAFLDHLLVSKDALDGLPLELRERTLRYHGDVHAARYDRGGHVKPRLWQWSAPGKYSGASDHLPLSVEFRIIPEPR